MKFSKTDLPTSTHSRKHGRWVAAFGAAILLCGADAQAQSRSCSVEFSVTTPTEIGALQLGVDYAAAGALGDFAANGCVFAPAGISDTSVEAPSDQLTMGWTDTTPFNGPALFATCQFVIPDDADADPLPGNFVVTIEDATDADVPPNPVSPTIAVAVVDCIPTVPVCLNGVLEEGEQCDDGNAEGGDGCGPTCANTGLCSAAPLSACKLSTASGKSKILFKDDRKPPTSNAKDQGQYQWKSGEATLLEEFDDAVAGSSTYSWCVYDNGVVVRGSDVPAGGTCGGKPCWKAAGTKGFIFKGDVEGVASIKLKAGDAGKASVAVKAKSKAGTFASPGLALAGPVVAQLVIDDGVTATCFESTFTSPTKNTDSLYSAKD